MLQLLRLGSQTLLRFLIALRTLASSSTIIFSQAETFATEKLAMPPL